MPRIEHIAIWVSDLDAMCKFYATTFCASVGGRYENAAKGFSSRFLTFKGGARLELMTTTAFGPMRSEPGAQRMGLTHVAISLGSETLVDELTSRLRASGATIVEDPRRTGDGYYESVILDPEGNRLELTA